MVLYGVEVTCLIDIITCAVITHIFIPVVISIYVFLTKNRCAK